MNKKKIAIIVAIIVCVAIAAGGTVGYMIVTKSSISVNQFKEKASTIDIKDSEITVEEAGDMNNVKEASILKDGLKYKVYFMQMESEQAAINAFAANREDFELFEDPTDKILGDYQKGLNYHTYTLVTGSRYYIVSQVKDTLVFASVLRDYKDDVETIVSNIGYLN